MTSSKRRFLSLPLELVEEILYKVPIESLVRFQTVCQQWHALFNDKRFIYKHLDLSQERFVRLDADHQSVQIFNPQTNDRLRLPFSDELHIQEFSKTIHCNGLLLSLCIDIGMTKIKGLAVRNPILTGVTWIEPSNSYRSSDIYGFGYDNVSCGNYKILRINFGMLPSEIEICEFKSKLWRSVDATTLECNALWGSVSMNGNMY
ncbi:unnamed protein product [Thlaspi arvense]|uniref:F-box domain-containing protein n=1 Tax=Thlaspi arvense TaxID=13288 RepID=A0AAU9SA99_THLAR|nr:unnamed protein product [Thlaspi arvense]